MNSPTFRCWRSGAPERAILVKFGIDVFGAGLTLTAHRGTGRRSPFGAGAPYPDAPHHRPLQRPRNKRPPRSELCPHGMLDVLRRVPPLEGAAPDPRGLSWRRPASTRPATSNAAPFRRSCCCCAAGCDAILCGDAVRRDQHRRQAHRPARAGRCQVAVARAGDACGDGAGRPRANASTAHQPSAGGEQRAAYRSAACDR